MKTKLDDEVMDVDENMDMKINTCDRCIHTFPLCMIQNTEFICGKRVSEVMQRIFIEQ